MNPKLRIAMVGAVSALALSGGLVAQRVSAHDRTGSDTLIEKLATKFNLNKDEVQKVFEEHHNEMKAEMEERMAVKLEGAVSSGALTAEQKELILEKQKEVQQRMAEIKETEDDTERRQAMLQLRTDLERWANENGLSEKWLHRFGGRPGHHSKGMLLDPARAATSIN